MDIIETQHLNQFQKEVLFKLWNENYPSFLKYTSLSELDEYLNNLINAQHFFLFNNEEHIVSWAFTFTREDEKWFAIIVDKDFQNKGCGTVLLNHLKSKEAILNGWMIDSNDYKKTDGSPYIAPAAFYRKNNFEIDYSVRLNHPKFSAVKIQWQHEV